MGGGAGGQALRQPQQEAVADQVAVQVVDRLEPVHIDHHHRGRGVHPAQPVELFVEGAAVAQPGQRVAFGQIASAFQRQPLVMDVLEGADPFRRERPRGGDPHPPRPHPAPAVVGVEHPAFQLQRIADVAAAEIGQRPVLGVDAVQRRPSQRLGFGAAGQRPPAQRGEDPPAEVGVPQHHRAGLKRRGIAFAAPRDEVPGRGRGLSPCPGVGVDPGVRPRLLHRFANRMTAISRPCRISASPDCYRQKPAGQPRNCTNGQENARLTKRRIHGPRGAE